MRRPEETGAGRIISRFFGRLGYLASILFALVVYIVFWPDTFVSYVPDLSTVESTMWEMGLLGSIALGYLISQLFAMSLRDVGSIWAEILDLFLSIVPLIFVVVGIYHRGGISGLNGYEFWAMILFGMAVIADVFIVTVITFELFLRANDFVSRR